MCFRWFSLTGIRSVQSTAWAGQISEGHFTMEYDHGRRYRRFEFVAVEIPDRSDLH